jgi:small neutral amino acid transporter SnatA (MarC family)
VKLFDPDTSDPRSIDAVVVRMAKRRQLRERISMILAGAIVVAMVVTFYRILVS